MNVPQRIVLIIGAVALIWAIWTTPRVVILQGSYFDARKWANETRFIKIMDFQTALTRSIGIVGGTLFVFFALKGVKKRTFKKDGQIENENKPGNEGEGS